MPRPNSIRLNCESLEARDVPAIILAGTQAQTGTFPRPITPDGGAVTIQEVVFVATDIVVTTAASGNNFANADAATRNKSATASDIIKLSNNGGTLTIDASDGIFLRYTNNNGTFFQFRGTTLTINNVTGLNVNLQLGGKDKIVDKTNLNATLIGGPGGDTITATGGVVKPFVIQQLSQPGGADPAKYSLLQAKTPRKKLKGQGGNDTLNGPRFGFKVILNGGDGRDNLTGGLGPDILIGGAGVDVLRGLGGRDNYNAIDNTLDYIFNRPGDAVRADPFDSRSSP